MAGPVRQISPENVPRAGNPSTAADGPSGAALQRAEDPADAGPVKPFLRWGPSMLLAGLALAGALALGSAARGEEERPPERVATLESLHHDPQAALGQLVRLRFQFDAEVARWNPYLTRFGSGEYRAFRVWSDGQFLWEKDQWDAPLAQLYVRRGGVAERALAGAPQLARFEAIGRVRQVLLGRPWIELEQVRRIGDEISESTLLHASRAVLAMEDTHWAMAREHLERALVGSMPPAAREELNALRAITLDPPRLADPATGH